MIDYIRSRLAAKLFVSYLTIILVGLAVLIAASQFALPSSLTGTCCAEVPRSGWRMMGQPNAAAAGFRAADADIAPASRCR
jgi:hypothetical protein